MSELVSDGSDRRWRELPTLLIGAADGSRLRPLGIGSRPRLSPDGRWVAFVRDDHTYVVASTNGRPSRVARNAVPIRWSPSSRYLVTAAQGRALGVFDVRTRRVATVDRDATFHGASFSPSSEEIVWARQEGRAYSTTRSIDIVRARVDGSAKARLVSGGQNAVPVWGTRRIAFGRIRPGRVPQFPIYELWTMTSRGDERERVTRTSHIPVDWSADGRLLLTATYGPSQSVMSLVEPATGDVRVLLANRFLFPQALSRDGRSALAWVWDRKNKPDGNLVRVGSDGSRRTLVRKADELADWNV
jgi:Tol biopolymer transport system component